MDFNTFFLALKDPVLGFLSNPNAWAGLLALIFLYSAGEWDLKKKAAELILEAEKQLELVGLEKREYVVDKLYALLPEAVRRFVPKGLLAMLVQQVLDRAYARELDKSATLPKKE